MQDQNQHSLNTGTILNHYKINRVLGAGGFGITYLAEDMQLGMKVVIKEYFPNEFAIRYTDSTIIAKTSSDRDFSKGLLRFKEEAQILARFNHPSIVKILGYFEANNTAYFVMEYEEGKDLSQVMKHESRAFTEEEILSIMMPILEGLKEVHNYNYLHRDIKPGNILLRNNHSPVLIDFGASKLAIGEASKSITSMLTEGYAPLEQYSTDIKQQGPFTDLYAIGAVMYKMITGEVPPSAQTRSYQLLSDDNDPLKPLTSMSLSGYDKSFLKAIDRALSIKGKDRPQNVQEFQTDIAGKLKIEVKGKKGTPKRNKGKKSNSGIMAFAVIFFVIAGGYYYVSEHNDEKEVKNLTSNVIQTTANNDQELLVSKKEYNLKEKIEEQRLKKVQEEIAQLRKEKAEAHRIELERLRKDKAEREWKEAERIRLEREKAEKEQKELERIRLEEAEQKRLETEKALEEFPLIINTTPSNARVQILNIKPKYHDGIKLKRGKYKIRVSKSGYERVDFWVDPSKKNIHNIALKKITRVSRTRSTWVGNCKVTIFKDGSVGAELYGTFKQWNNMSSSAKSKCQDALNKAKNNTTSRTRSTNKTKVEKSSRVRSAWVGNCKVTIFKDGSVGAELYGTFKQWNNMSSSAKSKCQDALNKARNK